MRKSNNKWRDYMKSDAGLKLDIARSCFVSPVEAVQGDGSLCSISVELTDSGKPWYPPAGTEISVAYVGLTE